MLIATSVEKMKTSAKAFINIITVNNRIPIYFLEFQVELTGIKLLKVSYFYIIGKRAEVRLI